PPSTSPFPPPRRKIELQARTSTINGGSHCQQTDPDVAPQPRSSQHCRTSASSSRAAENG
ncbi:Unknown protein, partial [Striga hermonthica]